MTETYRWHWIGLTVLAAALAATPSIVPLLRPTPISVTKSHPTTGLLTGDNATPLVGTASCSARGCHGSIDPAPAPERCQQNEYATWSRDPHADAYRTLFSERTRQMNRLLGSDMLPHDDPRCLACHSNPRLNAMPAESSFVQREKLFGVGCESCHGSANSWLVPHTAPDWRQKKHAFAMPDLTDPVVAAKTCAGCHVGSPANSESTIPRDVNHDLIAAGHPRLAFEFGAYFANMPPHWRPRKHSDVQLWAVGQLVSAQSALDVLAHRARTGPWPELAEYDCFACHHSLASQDRDRRRGKPGTLPWGTWYFALARELGGDPQALDALEGQMHLPYPERGKVVELVKAARKGFNVGPFKDAAKAESLVRAHVVDRFKTGTLKLDPCWDSAEQMYLALAASSPGPAHRALAEHRAFAPGFMGPGVLFRPSTFFYKLQKVAK